MLLRTGWMPEPFVITWKVLFPMSAPCLELKNAENSMLSEWQREIESSAEKWADLRELFSLCSEDAEASEAICWHGVAALLAEYDSDFERAIYHRNIEIQKILWIQEEKIRNPTGGFQTQDYEDTDLRLRRQMVAALESRLDSGQ